MKDCELCELINQFDTPDYIASFELGKLFLNWNQIYLGRVMYVYNEHLRDITELSLPKLREVDAELHRIACIIRKEFSPDLLNVASLGNHTPHLHWHIIPRYKTDANWGMAPWPHNDWFPTEKEKHSLVQRIKQHFVTQEG